MKPCCAIVVVFSLASATAPASAQSGAQPVVWYRASAGCPDGAAFLSRLERRGLHGKIASVGDRVDFVVTLGSGHDGPSGTLERQTDAGTVAVRALEAESCEDVADGIALSLALTFQPAASTSVAATAPDSAELARRNPARAEPRVPRSTSRAPGIPDSATRGEDGSEGAGHWALGAQAMLVTGIAPTVMPVMGVFVERAFAGRGVLRPNVRVSLLLAQSTTETSRGDLRLRLGTVRLEGCPVAFGAGAVALHPCAAVDVGVAVADGGGPHGRSDASPWLDAATHARLAWSPLDALVIEGQAGAVVPITRHELAFANPAEVAHTTATVAFAGGLGAAFRWK
jgi:hypothetical protein